MTPAALALIEAERRLLGRVQALAARLDAADDTAWPEYLATTTALRALIPEERRGLATTREMAEKFGLSPKTIRKLGREKKLESIRLGARGRGAIRWRSA
jgi:hypothetical protein